MLRVQILYHFMGGWFQYQLSFQSLGYPLEPSCAFAMQGLVRDLAQNEYSNVFSFIFSFLYSLFEAELEIMGFAGLLVIKPPLY